MTQQLLTISSDSLILTLHSSLLYCLLFHIRTSQETFDQPDFLNGLKYMAYIYLYNLTQPLQMIYNNIKENQETWSQEKAGYIKRKKWVGGRRNRA